MMEGAGTIDWNHGSVKEEYEHSANLEESDKGSDNDSDNNVAVVKKTMERNRLKKRGCARSYMMMTWIRFRRHRGIGGQRGERRSKLYVNRPLKVRGWNQEELWGNRIRDLDDARWRKDEVCRRKKKEEFSMRRGQRVMRSIQGSNS